MHQKGISMEGKQKVRLGDGVLDEVKSTTNDKLKEVAKAVISAIADYLIENASSIPDHISNLPDYISNLLKRPEIEQKVCSVWSKQLYEKGLIPKLYSGLPDKFLIDNLHQDGYLEGIYTGYVLATMALIDNNAPKELILDTRHSMMSKIWDKKSTWRCFENREDLIRLLKTDKYCWIEEIVEKEQKSQTE